MRRGVIGTLGIGKGEGGGKGWVKEGQFTSNLGLRWTDPVTARRVPSKWRGVKKGSKGNQQREAMKQGECAMYIVIYVRVI